MLDELKEEAIVNKVGGRFKLSTLIQKRLVQLNRGSPALVDTVGKPTMATVVEEILQDKIFLDATDNVIMAVDDAPDLNDDGGPNIADL
jgi:DNA-directed RNA polymerase subunit omega